MYRFGCRSLRRLGRPRIRNERIQSGGRAGQRCGTETACGRLKRDGMLLHARIRFPPTEHLEHNNRQRVHIAGRRVVGFGKYLKFLVCGLYPKKCRWITSTTILWINARSLTCHHSTSQSFYVPPAQCTTQFLGRLSCVCAIR